MAAALSFAAATCSSSLRKKFSAPMGAESGFTKDENVMVSSRLDRAKNGQDGRSISK